jgi:hypothetical protein
VFLVEKYTQLKFEIMTLSRINVAKKITNAGCELFVLILIRSMGAIIVDLQL